MPDTKMKEILAEMLGAMAGTWSIVVADNDGMLLSSWTSPDNKLPPEMLCGFIQTINDAIDAFKKSTAAFGKLDDVIYSLAFSYVVIKAIADGACFMVINAPKSVPLGIIRTQANIFAPKLEQALPGREPIPNRDSMWTVIR
jgi:predicted regulator of Ras-like GTPase activity (Roadblock/LC7/MglB family)